MTRVLVTGGAGFVGSHIVDLLVDEGYDVTALDNLNEQVHDGEPDYLNPDAKYVWGDVRDRDIVADLLRKTDVLCHQASVVGVVQSMYEIEEYVEVNTLGTARILDVVVEEEIDLEKMVVASSMSTYGEGQYWCSECEAVRYPGFRDSEHLKAGQWEHRCAECETRLEPVPTPETKPQESTTVYAITKKDQEELTRTVGRAFDIPTVALRYFNIYGSRQSLDNPYAGVPAIFSSRIKNGNPPLLYEDGEQSRDFVHVSDVARANLLAIESDVYNDVVNIGTGVRTTVREVAETLLDLYGKRAELEAEVTGDFREGDVRHCHADPGKAKEVLGFEAEVGFEEGMRELVAWGRDRTAEDNFDRAEQELAERGLKGED